MPQYTKSRYDLILRLERLVKSAQNGADAETMVELLEEASQEAEMLDLELES